MSNQFPDSPDNVRRDYDDPESTGFTDRPSPRSGSLTDEERQMALFAHLGGIVAGFIIPLVIMIIKKDQSRFIENQAKEALNFQLTILIYTMIAAALTVATCGIAFPLLLAPAIIDIVYCILAGMAANRGEWYRYPSWTCFRMVT